MLIDKYTLIKRIGNGSFGEVFLTSKQGTSIKYPTKKIEKSKYLKNPKANKYLFDEISILKDINHLNLLKIIDVKENLKYIFIITEYYNGGTLAQYLVRYQENNNHSLSENIVQYIMIQIIDAMKYLHNKNIVHRDLSLENILINEEDEKDKENENIMKGVIKIIDFGFSRYLKKGELSKSNLGIPLYMSPIILNKLNKNLHYKDVEFDEKENV